MTALGLLVKVDGSTEMMTVRNSLDIRTLVGGEFDWTSMSDIICYCYEWALYDQVINPVATSIYWAHNGVRTELAGTVLIMGAADAAGDETNVPPRVVEEAAQIKAQLGEEFIAKLAVKADPATLPPDPRPKTGEEVT
jgi:hypothetical protein